SFVEELRADNVGTYNSSFDCTGIDAEGTGTTIAEFEVGTDDISCTFVNAAATRQITLVKEWVNGQAGDEADLMIESEDSEATDTSISNGDLGSWTDAGNTVTMQATIGQPVTVSEVLDVAAGDESDYDSSISCTYTGGAQSAPARTLTLTSMPNADVTCVVTNEAEVPTLELIKEVEGADVPDTNWQLFGTPTTGDVVTDADGGDVDAQEVKADTDVDLSEEIRQQFAGSGEFDPSEWTCVSGDDEIDLVDSEPGTATLPGLDKGENVVCTIVNEHQPQGYFFEKTVVDSVQNDDGSWTVTYEIRVHNKSVLVPIEYDLEDTVSPVEGVTFDEITWGGPTSGSFGEGSLSAVLATDQELEPFEGDNDDIYTVEVDLTVDAIPAPREECEEGEGGIAIVNTADITSEGVDGSDDACGTVHYDDVSIEKTAGLAEGQTSVEAGDVFDYVLTVTNNGTRTAEDVLVEDDDISDRLEILGLTVSPDTLTWGVAPGYEGNDVALTIDELAVGESATITIEVEFLAAEVGEVPPVAGDDEAPVPTPPLEVLENTACVTVTGDRNPENDCASEEVPVRDISAVVYTRCVADAPLLGWTVTKSGLLTDEPIEFLWTPDNGTAETSPAEVALTQPGGTTTWSNEIEWPGSAFTPSGISIDYPGWRPLQAADYAPGGGYYLPGTDTVMTAEEQAEFVFNGLILDPSELDFAWRGPTTITFTVNPELVFEAEYPAATPECFVARHTDVQIEKTASAERMTPGDSFTYTIEAENVSDDSAAENVVITDKIPADIRITDVSWVGEGDADAFPNYTDCAVSGQAAGGYGGTLTCTLFGPLQPAGSGLGASAAPVITLAAMSNPATTVTTIDNVAVVDYNTFGDPDDKGRDADNAVIYLSILAMTGSPLADGLIWTALLALFAGAVLMHVARRRSGGPALQR
ncbi:MAG TPA: hypothetical protein VFY91_17950, partial [Microbacterium sp.]|nr:hypothetical protein [Microbacterium sp.]